MIQSYPWYIADWRESETRMRLSLPERALYRELLDYCYLEGSLPVDHVQLSRIAGCTPGEIRKYWPAVEPLFCRREERMVHAKVDEVRKRLEVYHEQKRHAGSVSGRTRRERTLNSRSQENEAPLKSAIEQKEKQPIAPLKSVIATNIPARPSDEPRTINESVKQDNGCSTGPRTKREPPPTTTPTTTTSPTNELTAPVRSHAEFPQTAIAIRDRFPATDDIFIAKLADVVTQATLSANIAVPPTDPLIAEAVRECTKTAGSGQTSAGLYLRTVPQCVKTWMTQGRSAGAPPPAGSIEAAKAKLREIEARKRNGAG